MCTFGLKKRKAHVVVFVDYEHWYYSLRNIIGIRPDLKRFKEELEEEFDIDEIMVFGDFSSALMSAELARVRAITNTIIATGNRYNKRKKDMTDFIMLDYIYQHADEKNKANTYVLFTGDGHFQSVTKYLTNKKKKRVIVYGVRDAISRHLRETASEVREVPTQDNDKMRYGKHILDYLKKAERDGNATTFMSTASAVAEQYGLDRESVVQVLSEMVDSGDIKKEHEVPNNKRTKKVLLVQWERMAWYDAGNLKSK